MPESLAWTEKVALSKRILDPLSLSVLKYMEDYFLLGITTQTDRLRYYSFLIWAWQTVKDKKVGPSVISAEKIITFASAYHHISNYAPTGIRNLGTAKKFLTEHEKADTASFVEFGRNNRTGYGNYYYRGPLKSLKLLWQDEEGIFVSGIAKRIAYSYEKALGNSSHLLWKASIEKSQLVNMAAACPCSLSSDEKALWRDVFFAFIEYSSNGDIVIDTKAKERFMKGNYQPSSASDFNVTVDEDLYARADNQKSVEKAVDSLISPNNLEFLRISNFRRDTLLLLLCIISQAQPEDSRFGLGQTIRDALYYKETLTHDGQVRKINFYKLEEFRKIWEVFVHDLYYIDVLERTFTVIIDNCRMNPLGISLNQIVKKINPEKLVDNISVYIPSAKSDSPLGKLAATLADSFTDHRSSLSTTLNERAILKKMLDSENEEEIMSTIMLLLLLCQARYPKFSQEQIKLLDYKENRTASIRPDVFYKQFQHTKLSDFPLQILDFVRNRHKVVASRKYYSGNTKAWLFTEEDEVLYFYGKSYPFHPYREAKWRQTIELLSDMGLLERNAKTKTWQITPEGTKWIEPIQ